MAGNGLLYIDNEAFKNCKLQEINFSDNKLSFNNRTTSPFEYCSDLQKMDLSRNKISKILSDWKKNPNLIRLILNQNHIKYIQVCFYLFYFIYFLKLLGELSNRILN